jgi:hypothetical protein
VPHPSADEGSKRDRAEDDRNENDHEQRRREAEKDGSGYPG